MEKEAMPCATTGPFLRTFTIVVLFVFGTISPRLTIKIPKGFSDKSLSMPLQDHKFTSSCWWTLLRTGTFPRSA